MKAYDGLSGRYAGVTRQRFVGPSIIEPFTVAPCGEELVLTSFFSNEVQVWDPATSTEVSLWNDFAVPMNAIEFGGGLAVAELGSSGVVWMHGDGTRTRLAGPLYVPTGLAASGGDLWAADWATGVVWQLVDEGTPLAAALPVAGGLAGPEGLAVDADGCLLVVESLAGRATRIDPATGATRVIAGGVAWACRRRRACPRVGLQRDRRRSARRDLRHGRHPQRGLPDHGGDRGVGETSRSAQ